MRDDPFHYPRKPSRDKSRAQALLLSRSTVMETLHPHKSMACKSGDVAGKVCFALLFLEALQAQCGTCAQISMSVHNEINSMRRKEVALSHHLVQQFSLLTPAEFHSLSGSVEKLHTERRMCSAVLNELNNFQPIDYYNFQIHF